MQRMRMTRPAKLSLRHICLIGLLIAGCGSESSLTPMFPTSESLPRPDRVIVEEFAISPDPLSSTAPPVKQSAEELKVGGALAKKLAENLVAELRRRKIEAYRMGETAAPGDVTVSIKGQFLRARPTSDTKIVGFESGSGVIRTHLYIFQGGGLRVNLVAEGDTETRTEIKPGVAESTLDAGARQVAVQIADRIADYYDQRGWLK